MEIVECKTLVEALSLNQEAIDDVGSFVERKVNDLLSKFAPPAWLYPDPRPLNPGPGDPKQLCDILFFTEKVLLLIECKGRTVQAHLGDRDSDGRLERWIDKTLSSAQKQLRTACDYMRGRRGFIGTLPNNHHVLCNLEEVQETIPIVIVYRVDDFLWRDTILKWVTKYPNILVLSLLSLCIIVSFLTTANELCGYLGQRRRLQELE